MAEDKVAVRLWAADTVEVAAARADTAVPLRAVPAVAEDKVVVRLWVVDTLEVVAGTVVSLRAIPTVVADEVGQEVKARVAVRIRAAEVAAVVESAL